MRAGPLAERAAMRAGLCRLSRESQLQFATGFVGSLDKIACLRRDPAKSLGASVFFHRAEGCVPLRFPSRPVLKFSESETALKLDTRQIAGMCPVQDILLLRREDWNLELFLSPRPASCMPLTAHQPTRRLQQNFPRFFIMKEGIFSVG
jgi:hypothetical protein